MGGREAAVAAAGICCFLNLYAPQAVLPQIAASFGVTAAQIGLAVTAALLAVALTAPFAGLISDRLGRKRLIVGAGLALAFPTLMIATATNLESMLVWRFLQGLLLPFVFVVTVGYIGDECQGADGVRVASVYSLGAIVGGFGGRVVTGFTAELVPGPDGWRVGFMVIAGLVVLAAGLIAWLLPREQRFQPLAGGMHVALRTYRSHFANARLMSICVVGFGMLFGNVAVFTFMNFYLSAPPFGFTPGQLASVFGVYLLGLVTTSLTTGLVARLGRLRTLAGGIFMACLGLCATLVPVGAVVIAGLAALSGGLFVVQAVCVGFIGAAVTHAKSSAVGIYVTIYYIGGSLGGVLPGLAWHAFGWTGVVFLIIAVLLAVLALAARFWPMPPAPRAVG
jgi:YNFM family putative membrane transporter